MKDKRVEFAYVNPAYDIKNNPWTISVFNGLLGIVNVEEKKERITRYCGIVENGNGKYTNAIKHGEKFFLLPDAVNESPCIYVVYDNGKEEYLRLKQEQIPEQMNGLSCFPSCKIIGDYIFAFGAAYPAVIRIDTRSNEVDYIDGWFLEVESHRRKESALGYLNSIQQVLIGDELYIPFSCVNMILKLNLKTLCEELIDINVSSEGFSCISEFDENRFLLTGAGKDSDWLYVWNKNTGIVEKKIKMQETPGELSVKYMLRTKLNDVYLFPWQNWLYWDNLDIYRFDAKTWEVENTNLINSHRNGEKGDYLFGHEVVYACWKDDFTFLYVTGKDLLWHEYNVVSNEYREYSVLIDETEEDYINALKMYYRDLTSCQMPLREKVMDLGDFLRVVVP